MVPEPVGAQGESVASAVVEVPLVERERSLRDDGVVVLLPVVPVASRPVTEPAGTPVVFPVVPVVEELPDDVVPVVAVAPADEVVPAVDVELVDVPGRRVVVRADALVSAPAGSHGAVVGEFAPGVPGCVPVVPVVPGVVCVFGVVVEPVLCAAVGTASATASAAAALAAMRVLFTRTSSVERTRVQDCR